MHLISALIAGIRGAENGTADFYLRGTSTHVTYYSDFEGTVSVASGQVTLDANGGAEVYVNQLVRVLVKDVNGTTIRDFVEGVKAPDVEVMNASFLGAAYSDGTIAAGNPTTLDAVLTKWLTSAGAVDWKVLYGGAGINLQTLASKIALQTFNVKAPEYGAIGNGTADDTVAINAAKTAAVNAGGGIVYFPPGTYRITAKLTKQAGVSLLGSGAGVSILTTDTAATVLMDLSTNTNRDSISGLSFQAAQANAQALLKMVGPVNVAISRCTFGNTNTTGPALSGDLNANFVTVDECVFRTKGAVLDSGFAFFFSRCNIVAPAVFAGFQLISGYGVYVEDCIFDLSAATTGTYYCIKPTLLTGGACVVRGCSFTASGGATITCITPGTVANPCSFSEEDNIFENWAIAFELPTGDSTAARVHFGSRVGRTIRIASNVTPLEISAYEPQCDTLIVERSSGANQTIQSTGTPVGCGDMTVYVYNNSGANIAAQTVMGGAPVAQNDTIKRMWHRRYSIIAGVSYTANDVNGLTCF